MDTLLLDPDTWDLVLDASGNIAVATGAYAQAQDAASQCRLFQRELYYDTAQGIPYWQSILGYIPRVPLLKAKYQAAALLVPGVTRAVIDIQSVAGRTVSGIIYITNDQGQDSFAKLLSVLGVQ